MVDILSGAIGQNVTYHVVVAFRDERDHVRTPALVGKERTAKHKH